MLGALALLGVLMVAQAMRMREYAVPLALAFLAVVWGKSPVTRAWVRPLPMLLVALALVAKIPSTVALVRHHLPTDLYRGARPLLLDNANHPVLNLAEADFGMLRIEYTDVVCAHALSRYFLLPNRPVYDDLWYLYRSAGASEADTERALRRFHARGVRLVASHGNRLLDQWAQNHPAWLQIVFRSEVSTARLYRLAVPEHGHLPS